MTNGSWRSTTRDERPTLGALVADISRDLRSIIRGEIALAKAELKASAQAGGLGAALLALAGLLVAFAVLLITWGAVYGLSAGTGLPLWASFLIVAGINLLIAAILAAVGVRSLKRARGPEQAVAEAKRTGEILQSVKPVPPTP